MLLFSQGGFSLNWSVQTLENAFYMRNTLSTCVRDSIISNKKAGKMFEIGIQCYVFYKYRSCAADSHTEKDNENSSLSSH